MPRSFQPIGSILQAVVQRHGLTARLFEHQLPYRWAEIAGSAIAAQSRPEAIRFRKLYLLVHNSVWLQQLVFLKPALLEKVNAAAGSHVVTDIVLRIGELQTVRSHDTDAGTPTVGQTAPVVTVAMPADGPVARLQDADLRGRLAEFIMAASSSAPPTASSVMTSAPARVP